MIVFVKPATTVSCPECGETYKTTYNPKRLAPVTKTHERCKQKKRERIERARQEALSR